MFLVCLSYISFHTQMHWCFYFSFSNHPISSLSLVPLHGGGLFPYPLACELAFNALLCRDLVLNEVIRLVEFVVVLHNSGIYMMSHICRWRQDQFIWATFPFTERLMFWQLFFPSPADGIIEKLHLLKTQGHALCAFIFSHMKNSGVCCLESGPVEDEKLRSKCFNI